MATVAASRLYREENSKTTNSWTGIASANVGTMYCYINRSSKISILHSAVKAVVIQPFLAEIAPKEEGYLATSSISNGYELGTTPGQAISNYLEFLVDELIWLQKHEANLSASIHDDLRLLQSYLRIV